MIHGQNNLSFVSRVSPHHFEHLEGFFFCVFIFPFAGLVVNNKKKARFDHLIVMEIYEAYYHILGDIGREGKADEKKTNSITSRQGGGRNNNFANITS